MLKKLMAIPKLSVSTSELMGILVIKVLKEWKDVPDWLPGLCFDTKSSNADVQNCAITIIHQAYGTHSLLLACNHHVIEIILAGVFDQFFRCIGSQIGIFSRFKEYWTY